MLCPLTPTATCCPTETVPFPPKSHFQGFRNDPRQEGKKEIFALASGKRGHMSVCACRHLAVGCAAGEGAVEAKKGEAVPALYVFILK